MNVQFGAGLPHYQSAVAFQRGHGLGGLLGKLLKTIIPLVRKPIVKNTLKRIGKTALKTGISAVHETVKNPKTSLKDNLKREVHRNLKYAFTPVVSKETAKPLKRKQVRKRTRSFVVPKKKSRKLDVFDFQ